MNILLTQTAYPPSVGGAQIHLHQIGKYLARQHAVQVASFWRSNRTDWLLGTTLFAPGGEAYELERVQVHPLSFSRREKLRMAPWVFSYYLLQAQAIRGIARSLLPQLRKIGARADLIHHGRVGREPLAFASLALARERKIPFVLTPYHHPRWNSRFYRHYHHLYRQADGVIVLTEAEGRTLESLGVDPRRIYVSGTGAMLSEQYDARKFRQAYGVDGPMVLFMGQKYAYKGLYPLLQSAEQVWREIPNTQFVFVGPRTDYSQRLFRDWRDPRIHEIGVISEEEKTSALAACDVFCLPSSQECFGAVYLEAWAMGKPVIAGYTPATAEVVNDGVDGFVGPAEPGFLASRILTLLKNPAQSAQMATAGKAKAEQKYAWRTLADGTEEIYQRVLSS